MKKLLLMVIGFMAITAVRAQEITCTPDPSIPDTVFGVFPLPYTEDNPLGGISDTACLNTPFEFTFTLKIPSTIEVAGVPLTVENVAINPDSAIMNLPVGIDYVCNPPNCLFPADSASCILLSGMPTEEEEIMEYELAIAGVVTTKEFPFPIPVQFPDTTGTFPEGQYTLFVRPEGSISCNPSSTTEPFANQVQLTTTPNPFTDWTQLEITSKVSGRFVFTVHNMLGTQIHREVLQLQEGQNRIDFDGSNLASGIYVYALSAGNRVVSGKMVRSR